MSMLFSANKSAAPSAAPYAYDASGNRTDRTVGTNSYLSSVSNTSNRLVSVQDDYGL
jgi:hypothetical protein